MTHDITIQKITDPTSHRDRILALHRANAKTLGLLPFAAFDEYIQKRQILLALDKQEVVAYLLYRTTRGRATIVHLCVDENRRGRGFASLLINALKAETKSLEGIGLSCRRDYSINDVWAKFGFEAVCPKTGRGKDAAELTYWWFSHSHSDLFSIARELEEPKVGVVIDANVFYDFYRDTAESEFSKSLLEDWIQESIELLITKELRNEIDKNADLSKRKESLAFATRFETIPTDDQVFQAKVADLKSLFSDCSTDRDESDRRQIAYAISGGTSFFVTRDERLIERCESLYATHGLRVLHPAELLTHLDSVDREQDYRPARIAGSQLTSARLTIDNLDESVSVFKLPSENSRSFLKCLRSYLAQPKSTEILIVKDGTQSAVLLGVIERSTPERLIVSLLRWTTHPLAPTMQRNFLRTCLDKAAQEGRNVVVVRGDGLSKADSGLLTEFGFACGNQDWAKVAIKGTGNVAEILAAAFKAVECSEFASAFHFLAPDVPTSTADSDGSLSQLERHLWPAKIGVGGIPTFLVTILPGWAEHFFDDELGSQLLLGLRYDLHLGVEGVYYRKSANNNMKAPGRVLWYVSKGQGDGSMTVKACSQLEEVLLGKPKELFRRFQRLGIYEWRNVYDAADKDIHKDITAFRFRMTERFIKPVGTEFLESIGVRPPFMSPRKLTDEQFIAIYQSGMLL